MVGVDGEGQRYWDHFDEHDLAANRAGRITPRQCEVLEAQHRVRVMAEGGLRFGVIATAVLLLGGAAAFIVYGALEARGDAVGVAAVLGAAGGALVLLLRLRSQPLQPPLPERVDVLIGNVSHEQERIVTSNVNDRN
jgi:hypothetical protein